MNIRLVKATQADFTVYKKYYQNTNYHWFYGERNRVERREALKKPRKVYKPIYNRKGERRYRASEKFAMFNEEQFKELLQIVKKSTGAQLLIIHKDKKIIGYIRFRGEGKGKAKRIVEFALEPDYQRYQIIQEVINKLNQKAKKQMQYEILFADEFGQQLLKHIPEISVTLNRKET